MGCAPTRKYPADVGNLMVAIRSGPPDWSEPIGRLSELEADLHAVEMVKPSGTVEIVEPPRVEQPKPTARQTSGKGTLDARAAALLFVNPGWTNEQIAAELECNVKSLNKPHMVKFKTAKPALGQDRSKFAGDVKLDRRRRRLAWIGETIPTMTIKQGYLLGYHKYFLLGNRRAFRVFGGYL
jgi:hypothetical protein